MDKVEIVRARVSGRVLARLQRQAERTGRTRSELLREYLARGLDADESRAKPASQQRSAG